MTSQRTMARRLRYLALGDSYTIGEGVSAADRFPAQLTTRLRARGFAVDDPEIIARTGWTTDELWDGIGQREPQGTFALVTLLIGVNNQYRGYALETYRREFVKLLARAIELAGNHSARVIVVSIPDWSVTPFAGTRQNIAQEIDAFNGVNRAETLKSGARYLDITPLSRDAREDRMLLADDGLHPSGAMYAQWVEQLLPMAENVLANTAG